MADLTTMKHIPILTAAAITLLASVLPAVSQSLVVTLNVSSRPNPYISEWSSRRETAIVTITNPGSTPVDVKFSVKILLGAELQAETKFNESPILTIPARSTATFYGEDVAPFGAMKFYGGVESKTIRSGRIPDGNYSFCLRLLNPVTAVPLSAEVCRPFTIVNLQCPRLVWPGTESTIAPEERPIFRWSPVTPTPTPIVTYRFLLFEVLPGQRSMQAFQGNQPIVERTLQGQTQVLWLPELPALEPGMTYVWTVQALDGQGRPLCDPEGYADPFVLKVGDPAARRGPDVIERSVGPSGPAVVEGPLLEQAEARRSQQTPVAVEVNPQPPPSSCDNQPYTITPPACATVSSQTFAEGDSVTICGFTMKFKGNPTGGNSNLSGSGVIWVPWLRTNIAVSFAGIKVNDSNQICSGTVRATVDSTPETYPQQWAINMVGSFNWTKTQVNKLNTWIHAQNKLKNLTQELDLNQLLVEQTKPAVQVPLGFNNAEGVTIAITEMKFEPTGAHLNCIAAFPVNLDHNDTLGFKGANFPFRPNAPSVNQGKLALLTDVTFSGNINNSTTYDVTFRAEHGNAAGTYISWDCKGFRVLNVDMTIGFPRQWLTPIPDNGADRVRANLVTTLMSWSDWLLNISLPRCAVANTNGLELEVQTMVYDHSDTRNATGMAFPANYTGDQSVAFNGFYLKSASVVLPDKLRTFSNPAQPVKIVASNIIITKLGITGVVTGMNVINFPNGNVAGLGASIDTVKVELKNSSLLSAYMRGKIVLPVSKTTSAANAITYRALFNTQNGLQFTLQPSGPITADLFAGAKLTLDPTSLLSVTLNTNTTSFDLALNGTFDLDDVKIGNKVKVKLKDLKFQDLKMSWREGNAMTFKAGKWSFASPPKWLANFPITIDSISFVTSPAAQGEVLRGALTFDVVLNLSESTVSGRTRMEVLGAIEKPAGGKFEPKFVAVNVKEIDVHMNVSAVKVDGKITFYNDDPTYGDGFSGTLKAIFNSLQAQVDASARFGATTYQNNGNSYRYWGVEARLILPKPGIVFLPGVALYGFGGGAWRRMTVANMPKPDLNAVAGATSASGQTTSGAIFTPNAGTGFGFKAIAVIGTAPEPKTLNADATFMGEFSTGGGLTKISMTVDLWAAAALLERNKAPVWGTATVSYVPPTKVFDLNASVNFKHLPNDGSIIASQNGGVSLKLNINGSTGKWYFKLGEPTNLNTVKVLNAFTVQEYLMFGNNIQPQTGFLPSTIQGLNQAGVGAPSFSNQGISTQASLGQGFAAGFTVFGSTGDKTVDLMYRTQLKYGASGGFEINMSMLRYSPTTLCDGVPLGMNGWYAQGGLAAWFSGYAGIQITPSSKPACDCCPKVWKDCCNPFKCCALWCGGSWHPILNIKIGAWLTGGFPRPSWAKGQASSGFSVCGGLFSGSFTAHLDIGKQCAIGSPEPIPGVPAQDAVAMVEADGALVRSINPASNASGFPPDNSIGVVLGYKPDESFDVFERQSDGTIRKRIFQARYTATLDSLGPLGGVNVMSRNAQVERSPRTAILLLQRSASPNLLGEYGYRVSRGVTARPGQWVMHLDDQSRFRFTIVGELWELQGSNWVRATKKAGGTLTETRVVTFSTGTSPRLTGMSVVNAARPAASPIQN